MSSVALRAHGVAITTTATSSATVAKWRSLADYTARTFIKLGEAQRGGRGVGIGKENGFRELVKKDENRWDVNLDHLMERTGEQNHGMDRAESLGGSLRGVDDGWCSSASLDRRTIGRQLVTEISSHVERYAGTLLQECLGGAFIKNAQGFVVSHPGAQSQRWHADISPLFAVAELPASVLLPVHFVTVFVPLYHAFPAIGPTEFALGSHKLTRTLGTETVAQQYPKDEVVDELLKNSQRVGTMDCEPGDIVVMDGRLLHRGLANQSSEVRPLVYMSFCRPWYREYPSSQSAERSLFDSISH